ncbi:MAG TPA: TauD/TfdA family dioxygenase [Caulobacteraceae bacterium]|nr:TauD/TfdA family dioxygenase [Caulobacteraceae bacterium]
MTYRPLSGSFGVEVTDLDVARASEDELRELASIFYRRQVVVLRGQSLSFEAFDALTKQFGTQRPHFLDHLRMRGHPAILMLSNIFEDGRQIGIYEGACFWHTDVAYEDPPNSATIVYAVRTPKSVAAPTFLADQFAAYDALPERTKRRIDDLQVLHHYGNRDDLVEGSPTAAERLTDDQKRRVANVYHPLVMRHPVTGRRSLYGVAGSSFGILGMPDDEALDLLGELAQHATKPEFLAKVDYAAGDLAAWDTYSTLHKAPVVPKAGPDDAHARLLWRVSVTGVSPLVTPHVDRLETVG